MKTIFNFFKTILGLKKEVTSDYVSKEVFKLENNTGTIPSSPSLITTNTREEEVKPKTTPKKKKKPSTKNND